MLYALTKPFAKIALSVYFKKIYISNREVIPEGKPVILAANHPTAFIEPCILSCWLKQPLSFLARGDLYIGNKFVRFLYDRYRLIPVFRIEDAGYGNLKTNYASFDRVSDALRQNKAVMILAEGRTIHEKRLRPLRKGTARMVFGAWEKYGELDIHIVPVGVNFTNPDEFRSEVMIDFGPPIRALDYLEMYRGNPAKAVNALTRDLRKRLIARVIHIEKDEDVELTEQIFQMRRDELPIRLFPNFSTDPTPLFDEKRIADKVNRLPEPEKVVLKSRMAAYFSSLKNIGVTDRALMHREPYTLINALLLAIGWLPYLVGVALNAPPLLFGNWMAHRLAPSIEFRAAIAGTIGSAAYLLYLFIWGLMAFILGIPLLLIALLAIPLLGYYALIYRDLEYKWKSGKDIEALKKEERNKLEEMREEIFNENQN